ncbi:hypothetical protein I79_013356 [Cricetulus griseus]|uniref:Uncharacterized protein n=1 Tax=Cricetulus griseus TaxID=10029 RepID=G3HR94_CRIGR|nr:hypothetical protein I79_013356 [Cricetulus griseus]
MSGSPPRPGLTSSSHSYFPDSDRNSKALTTVFRALDLLARHSSPPKSSSPKPHPQSHYSSDASTWSLRRLFPPSRLPPLHPTPSQIRFTPPQPLPQVPRPGAPLGQPHSAVWPFLRSASSLCCLPQDPASRSGPCTSQNPPGGLALTFPVIAGPRRHLCCPTSFGTGE